MLSLGIAHPLTRVIAWLTACILACLALATAPMFGLVVIATELSIAAASIIEGAGKRG